MSTGLTTPPTPGIMARLRDETRPLHDAAEHHAFQRALAKGTLPRAVYLAWLGQMYHLHRALELHLRANHERIRGYNGVVRGYQFQEPYLADDLAFFGLSPARFEPSPATASAVDALDYTADADPLQLLGAHYVLEGSNNGSRFIARNIRRAYNLDTGRGDRYLDPYGDEQPARWQAFKSDMDAVGFTPIEQDAILAGANFMFAAIASISDDLLATQPTGKPADR